MQSDTLPQNISEFLFRHGIEYKEEQMMPEMRKFYGEMENGLECTGNSLQMIPTYIRMRGHLTAEKPVVVLDAGGTNLRTAVIRFDGSREPILEGFDVRRMPGVDEEISCDDFFSEIGTFLDRTADQSDTIAVCFSYPTLPLPDKDGVILDIGKQLMVRDLKGKRVGEQILKRLSRSGSGKKIVVINDSVATLLGGMSTFHADYDSYLGFILGTGTNICYIEKKENVKKLSGGFDHGRVLINVESGGYTGFHGGEMDRSYFETFADQDKFAFEKMVSGKYLGGLVLTILKRAVREGLFSDRFRENISGLELLDSHEVDLFASSSSGGFLRYCCGSNRADQIACRSLIDAVYERAAKLLTVSLTAALLKTGKGKTAEKPVCITAEGSTFYNSELLRAKIHSNMERFAAKELHAHYEFVKIENVTLLGTAIAGLLNEED